MTFDEAARIAQAGYSDLKTENMICDVLQEAQIGRDMFDKDRANICQECRGRKITALTPKRMYEDRNLCQCEVPV